MTDSLHVKTSFRLKEKILLSPSKRKQPQVNCPIAFPFTRLQQYISKSSRGACVLCSLVCFSVIVHHCCLCARASNNGLSWSCSTCFAESFKSFHYRNCSIIFLWLIYNNHNCNRLYIRLCARNFLNKWLLRTPEEATFRFTEERRYRENNGSMMNIMPSINCI